MAAPIRFLSGRQQQQKIGIEGNTQNEKVLEVVGQVGIGTTIFSTDVELEVRGDVKVSGVVTATSIDITGSDGISGDVAVIGTGGLDVDGQTDLDELVVAGVATFSAAVDVNSTLDVDGDTQLDDLNVAGVATFSSLVDANNRLDVVGGANIDQVNVTGIASFTQLDVSTGGIDVDGQADLDEVSVAGVATFSSAVDINAGLDVDGQADLDEVVVAGVATFNSLADVNNRLDVVGGANIDQVNTGVITATSLNVTDKLTTTGLGISIANGTGKTAYIEGPEEIWIDPHPVGVATTSGIVRIRGDLYVDGTNFIVDSERIELGDFRVGIATTISTNALLNGAGLGIGSESIEKTITWNNASAALMSSENWNLASGKHYEIAGTDVLTSTTLGSGVVNSSLTNLGTLTALDVNGHTELDSVNASGISSATAFANFDYLQAPFGSTVSFTVTVASKSNHRYQGQGSGQAYYINGVESPFLTLTPGRTYRFVHDNTGSHPLKFYLEADKTTLYETNVNFQNTYTEITVTDETPIVLHYQCTNHGFMGNAIQTNSNVVNTNYEATIRNGLNVTGVVTAASFDGGGTIISDDVTTRNLSVSGFSTFSNTVDINGTLDVDGQADLDELVVAGVTTFSNDVFVGTGITIHAGNVHTSGIITASKFIGDGSGLVNIPGITTGGTSAFLDVNVSGTTTTSQLRVSGIATAENLFVSTGGFEVDGQSDLDELVVAGVATFSALIDANNRLDVVGGANIDQVNVTGIASFAQLDVSTGGIDVDGQADLDEVFVAGLSTFNSLIDANAGVNIAAGLIVDQINSAGVATIGGDISIADKIVHTGDTNTALRFPAADTFTIETAGSERVRVSSAGTISIGSAGRTDWDNSTNVGCQFQIEGLTQPTSRMSITRNSNDAFDGGIILGKSRGTSDGSATIVQDGDGLGFISFQGTDGTTMLEGAKIDAIVQSSVASDDMPTDLVFYTNNDTTTTEERLRITSTGTVKIGSNTLITPDANADNLVIDTGDVNSGLSILSATTGRIYFGDAADDEAGSIRYVHTDNSMRFETNSEERLRIDSSGRLMLGTTTEGNSSSDNLTVADTGACGITIRSGTTSNGGLHFSDGTSGTSEFRGYVIYEHNNDALRLGTNAVERIRITSAGNVGIGLTNPTEKLDVNGNVKATSFSGDGSALTGIAATDHVSTFDLVVAGISTFNDDVRILAGGLDVTGVVTATSFSGDLSGNADTATTATNVTVTANNGSTSETVYPIFVDGATGSQGAETDTALSYNPATDTLTAGTFSGAHSGNGAALTSLNASELSSGVVPAARMSGTYGIESATFTVTANNSTDETVYPVFVDGATGSQGAETDTGLSYNPSTGALTATTFSGALSGNSTTATTATNVTVADESSDTTCFPLFATAATGDLGPKSGSNLTFNSSTGALTATSFSGSGASLTAVNAATLDSIDSTSFLRSDDSDTKTSGSLVFNDDVMLTFGNLGDDMQIRSDGTNSLIRDTTGNLKVTTRILGVSGIVTASGINIVAGSGEAGGNTGVVTAVAFHGDGAVISGVVTATSFAGDGSALTGIAAGGSGEFNTGITSTRQITPLSFETSVFTFPSTSGRQYVIESINVANVDESVGVGTTVNIIASIQDATAAEQTYIAYNVPINTGGLVELLKNPIVAGPSDVIRMWTTNDAYVGTNNAAEVYMNFTEHSDSTDFISKFASTVSIAATTATTLYTSSSNPTVIEKIGLANRTDTGDFPISIKITSGTTTSYLAKNLIIPRYSTVDILDRPKRIETDAKIEVEVGSTSTIDVIIAGKKITS